MGLNNKNTDQEIINKLLSFLRERENIKQEREQLVWERIMSDVEKKQSVKKRKHLNWIFSAAAVFLLLLGFVGYYRQYGSSSSLERYVGTLSPVVTDSIQQIQIHLSEGDMMHIDKQTAYITYSAKGEISVEGKERKVSVKEKNGKRKKNRLYMTKL